MAVAGMRRSLCILLLRSVESAALHAAEHRLRHVVRTGNRRCDIAVGAAVPHLYIYISDHISINITNATIYVIMASFILS